MLCGCGGKKKKKRTQEKEHEKGTTPVLRRADFDLATVDASSASDGSTRNNSTVLLDRVTGAHLLVASSSNLSLSGSNPVVTSHLDLRALDAPWTSIRALTDEDSWSQSDAQFGSVKRRTGSRKSLASLVSTSTSGEATVIRRVNPNPPIATTLRSNVVDLKNHVTVAGEINSTVRPKANDKSAVMTVTTTTSGFKSEQMSSSVQYTVERRRPSLAFVAIGNISPHSSSFLNRSGGDVKIVSKQVCGSH